ncbi:MAG: glycoside hydrolase family 97 protein [Calditrichia bacterium]
MGIIMDLVMIHKEQESIMKRKMSVTLNWLVLFLLTFLVISGRSSDRELMVSSPDGKIKATFFLKNNQPYYQLSRSGRVIIHPSKLGFILKDNDPFYQNMQVAASARRSFDETWEQPWGEVRRIRNHYNELQVDLQEISGKRRQLRIVFRVFDDGLGFRYEFPAQENLQDFQIMDELTQFTLEADYEAWWIPVGRFHRYEYLYTKSPIRDIDTVHTPLTIETGDGLFFCIHEANLTDYASMTLFRSARDRLNCDLVPWSDGVKVKASTPHLSPWRTVQIAETPGDLITSYLVLNLNEPCRLEDVSWIKPGKYVGIWWGMHIGKFTWGSGEKHGATTERAKAYIDFAAKHGFYGVLIEGWNVGWDGNWVQNGEIFNFTQPYPDFDIGEVTRYAAAKGVKIIGHHETSGHIGNYERQMEDAFKFYKKYGIDAIKTGYVGDKVTSVTGQREWHHGQYMVRHYRKVVQRAADYQIMLIVHEPIKDTGIRRTWPNMMTREGARGMEYNAWSADGGNPPEHETIIPFTRGLAGPFDFTPGIFDLTFVEAGRPNNRVRTTLAKQLAIYVVIYSPFQMAADLPENYENQPAFQFIEDVAVDWEQTLVLNGVIGDYITIARKDRHSDDWYIGSLTDENGRSLSTPLDFLDAGRTYVAEIYADAPNAHWDSNPLALEMRKALVDNTTVLNLNLAPGGGQAIRIHPASAGEFEAVPRYRSEK